jgi:hemerythrin superfamily protein
MNVADIVRTQSERRQFRVSYVNASRTGPFGAAKSPLDSKPGSNFAFADRLVTARIESGFQNGTFRSYTEKGEIVMDVLEVLHDDHLSVKKLFLQVQSSGQSDQSRLFQQIRQELESHARAEEGIFYPAVEKIGPKAADAVATALAQHGDVLLLIAEIVKVGADTSEFASHLARLEEAVETHVKHEEDLVFSLAREHLGKDLVELGQKVKDREAALKAGGQIAGSE